MNVRPHRRSLVIVLLTAALLLTAAQFGDRPVDPRLLGRWTVHYAGSDATWPVPMLEFRMDGSATWWSSSVPQNRIYSPAPLRWSQDGNRLIWRIEYESLTEMISCEYDRLRYRMRDRDAVAPHEMVVKIVAVSDDELQLDAMARNASKFRWTLRRAD